MAHSADSSASADPGPGAESRVALVTGAAHRVGRAVALELAADGHDVVVHYRSSADHARQTATEIAQQHGVRTWTFAADLTQPAAIEALFERVRTACGRLDALVNSAASFESAPLTEISAEAWDAVQALNVRAPHLCIRAAEPLLLAAAEKRGGAAAVVNIADLSGVFPWRGYGHHGASKAALLHLTRVAALELAPRVRVNAVVPGAVLPPPGVDRASERWRETGERLPAGRTGAPRDVGRAVAFLVGSDFITGEVLFVDGGEHLVGNSKR